MSLFDAVGGVRNERSSFDLSHRKLFDCSVGQLYPVLFEEVLPSDVFEFSHINTIRSQPLVTPMYQKLDAYYHTFFIPARLLQQDFEEFITGGVDGDSSISLDKI